MQKEDANNMERCTGTYQQNQKKKMIGGGGNTKPSTTPLMRIGKYAIVVFAAIIFWLINQS